MANPLPIDESIALPPSIVKAAEAANALHAAAYGEPPAAEPPPTTVESTPAVAEQTPTAVEPPSTVAEQTPPVHVVAPPAPQTDVPLSRPEDRVGVDPTSWEGRYYAMEGRYRQSLVSVGALQEQMQELGDELMRVQNTMQRRAEQPFTQQPPAQKRLTDKDLEMYGPELIDVVRRAALDAVAPELEAVQNQARQVKERVAKQSSQSLYSQFDAAVPNWREINNNSRFKQWCRQPDVYSGQVRGKLLNAAVQAADAPRAIAFFNGFLNEEVATGNAPDPTPQPQPVVAPREAAEKLEAFVAPGKANPASGGVPVAADKPIFTRAQIAKFYDDSRRGHYAGRDADKARDEAAIYAAQREGRVR